jgi:hypothetical protein
LYNYDNTNRFDAESTEWPAYLTDDINEDIAADHHSPVEYADVDDEASSHGISSASRDTTENCFFEILSQRFPFEDPDRINSVINNAMRELRESKTHSRDSLDSGDDSISRIELFDFLISLFRR